MTAAIASVMVVIVCGTAVAQGPAAVRLDAARTETVQERRMVTGELRAVRMASVATQEPGLVSEIAATEGAHVKQGDLLARLDSHGLEIELRDLTAQEQVATALIEERRVELSWRQRDLETYRALSQREASNPKELYDAEAQLNIAKARHAAAERQLTVTRAKAERLQKRIDDMLIKAPFDGVVTVKHVELGEWAEEGAAIVDLMSTGSVDAWVDVPQQFAGAVMGKTLSVTIAIDATGQTFETNEVRIVPQVDSRARSFTLIARLSNKEGLLAPGMSITAQVPTGQLGEQLTIAKNALMRNDAGPFVYVAKSAGSPDSPPVAMPMPVQVMFSLKDRLVIRAGAVAAGDRLVVEGNERLFPMAPLAPLPGEPEPVARAGESIGGGR